MNHQDFKEVVFNKPKSKSKTRHVEVNKITKVANDSDTLSHASLGKCVGLKIQQARAAKGLSQREMALIMNLNVNIYNQYETGKVIPDNNVMQKLRQKLNTTFN